MFLPFLGKSSVAEAHLYSLCENGLTLSQTSPGFYVSAE